MSDIEVVQQIYVAMAARDLETLAQLVDEACVITQDPALPWGGRHVGHPGFLTFAAALTGSINSAVTTHDLFMADGDVIQVGHRRARRSRTARRSTSPRSIAGRSATAKRSPRTSRSTRPRCSPRLEG